MISDPATQVLDTLREASTLLQAGEHAHAREMLGSLIRAQPGCFDAHRMLAASLSGTGEFVRAQKELRICLRLRKDDVDTQVLLGQVLSAGGQAAEALAVLQQAWLQNSGNVGVACALARVLLAQGRAQDAVRSLEPVCGHRLSATQECWMLLGHALMLLGRPARAVDAFRAWLQREPDSHDARLRLAAALADAQRAEEAEAEVRACMRAGVRSPDAAFILARALLGQGRHDEAEVQLRHVVHVQPGHETAQSNLSELVWMRTADAGEACSELDAALRNQPRQHSLRIAKARLLLSARRAREALAEIDAGLALDAQDPGLLKAAATIALDLDGARALEYAQQAMQSSPRDRGALTQFGNASLAIGDARQALDVAAKLQVGDPTDGQALAMQADALRMLGDGRYHELLDYSHFVRAEFIDTPAGWPDPAAYLADLRAALGRAHTLKAHPIGNSLRQGSQVQLTPERSAEAAIRAFPQAIDGPIRRYMQALGAGSDPMRRRNTGEYRLSGMWSVRLRPHGFHVNHYHPQGWISSACYLDLPPSVERGGGEGWLKFGEPAFPTRPALEAEYFLKPEPGLLALFPSYMWHGTVPFSGNEHRDTRLTIAFDVVPARAE